MQIKKLESIEEGGLARYPNILEVIDKINEVVEWINDLEKMAKEAVKEEKKARMMKWSESTPIEELELSVRAYNCLKRHGIKTVWELRELSDEQLFTIRNLSKKNVEEITIIRKHLKLKRKKRKPLKKQKKR